ncbi:hypothetical protein [Microbacterium hydrocarbonoxydans]|uniref:hypothetical protein n=1 Tax=Microbacterium hydrocarbonoxydans TaxID=273678 RepID=UPI0013D9B861|nr:hypothetical protein [Microbacterium hydrocarbonoxydans]
MPTRKPLPSELGDVFSVRAATALGVSAHQLRSPDLGRPFRGARTRPEQAPSPADDSPYAAQAEARRRAARAYAPLLQPGQFISHHSAAALWRAPLPLLRDEDGLVVADDAIPLDVSTFGDGHLIRASGVFAHRARTSTSTISRIDGILVADAETTWASLGTLSIIDLVALGDYFCRVWSPGAGRPNVGMPPISTVARLEHAARSGRRVGIRRLREALPLIRTDSWSPRESAVRCHLVFAGLPEPQLNVDVHSDDGRFLGCVDLAYPELKIAIEYQSVLHTSRYSADVERLARLRAHGWIVIEVTAALLADPDAMVDRVRDAIRRRR